jgi:hypothetical protein
LFFDTLSVTTVAKGETFNLSHLTKDLTSAEEHVALVEEDSILLAKTETLIWSILRCHGLEARCELSLETIV